MFTVFYFINPFLSMFYNSMVLLLHVLSLHVLLTHVSFFHVLLIQFMFYQSSPVYILSRTSAKTELHGQDLVNVYKIIPVWGAIYSFTSY